MLIADVIDHASGVIVGIRRWSSWHAGGPVSVVVSRFGHAFGDLKQVQNKSWFGSSKMILFGSE